MILVADECIPSAMFRMLAGMLQKHRPPIEAKHLLELVGGPGVPDDVWVPELAKLQDVVVLTGDVGRKSGPRLPVILPAAGVRGIFLAGKLQQDPVFYKLRAILYVFPEIVETLQRDEPLRYKLVAHRGGYKLNDWPVG